MLSIHIHFFLSVNFLVYRRIKFHSNPCTSFRFLTLSPPPPPDVHNSYFHNLTNSIYLIIYSKKYVNLHCIERYNPLRLELCKFICCQQHQSPINGLLDCSTSVGYNKSLKPTLMSNPPKIFVLKLVWTTFKFSCRKLMQVPILFYRTIWCTYSTQNTTFLALHINNLNQNTPLTSNKACLFII